MFKLTFLILVKYPVFFLSAWVCRNHVCLRTHREWLELKSSQISSDQHMLLLPLLLLQHLYLLLLLLLLINERRTQVVATS